MISLKWVLWGVVERWRKVTKIIYYLYLFCWERIKAGYLRESLPLLYKCLKSLVEIWRLRAEITWRFIHSHVGYVGWGPNWGSCSEHMVSSYSLNFFKTWHLGSWGSYAKRARQKPHCLLQPSFICHVLPSLMFFWDFLTKIYLGQCRGNQFPFLRRNVSVMI